MPRSNSPANDDVEIAVRLAEGKLGPEETSDVDSYTAEAAPRSDKKNWQLQSNWPFYQLRYAYREYFAEFFGTMILLIFGNGVVATRVFNAGANDAVQSNAGYLSTSFGWGMGLAMALFVSMGVSGGHLNPAVTFANCLFGACPWRKFPGFFLAQLLGAMTGSACVYGIFKNHFEASLANLALGQTATEAVGGIFCTYPNVDLGNAVWSEILNTMLLMLIILGICDERLTPAVNFKPIAVGLLVFTLGTCTGWCSGYAMNPARDLGPRIFSAMLFGSSDPFTRLNYYFWVPTFVPFIGATLGMFIFAFFIVPN